MPVGYNEFGEQKRKGREIIVTSCLDTSCQHKKVEEICLDHLCHSNVGQES